MESLRKKSYTEEFYHSLFKPGKIGYDLTWTGGAARCLLRPGNPLTQTYLTGTWLINTPSQLIRLQSVCSDGVVPEMRTSALKTGSWNKSEENFSCGSFALAHRCQNTFDMVEFVKIERIRRIFPRNASPYSFRIITINVNFFLCLLAILPGSRN